MNRSVYLLALSVVFVWSDGAEARTFCCDTGNKTYCDEGLPAACYGQAYREVNLRGVTVRHYAAPLTPEQQAKKDAELARQREAEQQKREAELRDRKLVGTYPSLMDLDIAHDRVVADLEKGQQQQIQKLAEIEKRKKQLDGESEFYQKKPMPPNLKAQIADNANDIQQQKNLIITRAEEIKAAKKRLSEERARYIELSAQPAR